MYPTPSIAAGWPTGSANGLRPWGYRPEIRRPGGLLQGANLGGGDAERIPRWLQCGSHFIAIAVGTRFVGEVEDVVDRIDVRAFWGDGCLDHPEECQTLGLVLLGLGVVSIGKITLDQEAYRIAAWL